MKMGFMLQPYRLTTSIQRTPYIGFAVIAYMQQFMGRNSQLLAGFMKHIRVGLHFAAGASVISVLEILTNTQQG